MKTALIGFTTGVPTGQLDCNSFLEFFKFVSFLDAVSVVIGFYSSISLALIISVKDLQCCFHAIYDWK